MEHESEKTNYPLWIGSFLVVCALYVAIGLAFVFFYVPNSRAVGGVEAIMIEFALEAQAPVVEEISEEVREETVAENEIVAEPEAKPELMAEPEPEHTPEPESEPEPVAEPEPAPTPEPEPEPVLEPEAEITPPTPPSDMVEKVKPVKKIEKKAEPELKIKPKSKPNPKPKPKAEKTKPKPKPAAKKAKKTQKAKGPDLAAPKGQTFAAPKTNRNFGNQGKAMAGWKTKVQQKIARSAKRFDNVMKTKSNPMANVSFRYDARGVITSVTIARSSGNSAVDALAARAVQASSPIPAPPTGQAGSFSILVRIGQR